ncbi:MAG TPA: sulfatase [Planctomycetota bacterium]
MPPPEARRPARADGAWAVLCAALGLAGTELVLAWAERWFHAPAYFALSVGLTLAPALALGLVALLLGLAAHATLAAWSGAVLWACVGPVPAAAGTLGVALVLAPRAARALTPATLGLATAAAQACALQKSGSFAEHLGRKGDPWLEGVGLVLLLAGLLAAITQLLARAPARLARLAPLAAMTPALLVALLPRLERGDGEHRRPPPGYAASAPRGAGDSPSVFLLVLDTVRADHLPAYGYARMTTPELERLRRERPNAVVFPNAFANGTWTVPSHASLFTGQWPSVHGAHFALDGSVRLGFGLRPEHPTLAERLRAGGYATLAAYGNHWLRSVEGLGRGFERYLRAPDEDELPFVGEALRQRFLPGLLWEPAKGCARATDVNATLLSLVRPWSEGPNPLFVFANYVDAHGPYAPPAPFRGRFAPSDVRERPEHLDLAQSPARRAELEARYDEELLALDHELGRLFAELERLDLLRRAWIFVTSDHGEAFGEHGVLEHGTTVHNEVARVPLLVFPPEGTTLPVTDAPVSLVDVAATIAAIGGLDLPGPGRDLRAVEGAGTHVTAIEFYGDAVKAQHLGALAKRPARAVALGRHKLIAYADSFQLYDLENDPGELVDLSTALPNLVEHMKAFLPAFGEPTLRSDGDALSPEALDELRGLGYVGDID